jgi:hypothetical protein
MKKITLVALATAALAVPAIGSASTSGHPCSDVGTAAGNIRAYHVTCKTAHKVVRADIQGKQYRSFKCKSTRYQGGANVKCRSGAIKKVTFQVAD